jgi:hypothetical protein
MAEHDRVDFLGVEGEGVAVTFLVFSAALYQAAVQQYLLPAHVQNVAGARYFRGGAEKLEFH